MSDSRNSADELELVYRDLKAASERTWRTIRTSTTLCGYGFSGFFPSLLGGSTYETCAKCAALAELEDFVREYYASTQSVLAAKAIVLLDKGKK